MNRSSIHKNIKQINNLPTLPTVVIEVNRLLQDFDSPMEPLVELLEKDQSFVVKILKLVNSSFFGFKSRVSSLRHAVTLMGYNTISNAVLSVAVMDILSLNHKLHGFDIKSFWRHSIQVAVLGKFLASKTRLASTESAFTAGLLHDIGKVILINYFPEEAAAVIAEVDRSGSTFQQAEAGLHFTDHTVIGSFLAESWMLPDELIKSIRYHHQELTASQENIGLISLVAIANKMVHIIESEPGYDIRLNQYPQEIGTVVSNVLSKNDKWIVEIKKDMDAAISFFNKG